MLSAKRHVLIVDDDEIIGGVWKDVIEEARGMRATLCSDGRRAVDLAAHDPVDVLILDLNLPYLSGQEILPVFRSRFPEVPIVVITAEERVDVAVECMKAGVFDFLTKPVLAGRLLNIVGHAIEIRELKERLDVLADQVVTWDLKHPEAFKEIITASETMHTVFVHVESIARSPRAVLVTGESGTGKELIARTIHRLSRRVGRFVPVNVSGLDDTLFSDTLFGHIRGAFTGADASRRGLVDQAAGGTLFLDEIGDLDTQSQVKLLRLLQEGEYYRLGSDEPEEGRARIIAATNADLKRRQEEGTFRKDLYYRLQAHHISLPPLRDRSEDLGLLINHFTREAAEQLGRQVAPRIPEEVSAVLGGYPFPGNLRELQSLVFDAVSRSTGLQLQASFFRDYLRGQSGQAAVPFRSLPSGSFLSLKEMQDRHIREAMRISGGNQTAAGRLLKVSQATLSRWATRQRLDAAK